MKMLDAATVELVLDERVQRASEMLQDRQKARPLKPDDLISVWRKGNVVAYTNALNDIRALPDAREGKTCATCAAWRSDPLKRMCIEHGHDRIVPATHSCAAHREVPR